MHMCMDMYTEPELDHAWLASCAGFEELRLSVASEKLAEVGLRGQMGRHPLRVHSPHMATVFYLPVFEFVSATLGAARNCLESLLSVSRTSECIHFLQSGIF